MRNAIRLSVSRCLFAAMVCGTGALGCSGRGDAPTNGGLGGSVRGGGIGGQGGQGGSGAVNVGGSGGSDPFGSGGASEVPCKGASDVRLLPAPQRILRLTMNELQNTIRYLIDETETRALISNGLIGVDGDDSRDVDRQFPALRETIIVGNEFTRLDLVAQHVANYVAANFGTLSGCATPTDACAAAYLNKLAAMAFRRPLTSDEQLHFTSLYTKLRAADLDVNGYQASYTVEEAAGYAVDALMSSPQMLWRWEIGNPALAANFPLGIPLTDYELATQLSFFLTDQPPDDPLLALAGAGTLRANLGTQVDRLLGTQAAKDWLTKIVETYFLLNQLPHVSVDSQKFPLFTPQLVADLMTEERKFLDSALWSGGLTELLLSRTTFLNTSLASDIYGVAVPPGATATNFVRTILPADQRSGLLTNAGFLLSHGHSDGIGMIVPRGKAVAAAVLCMPPPPPDDANGAAVGAANANVATQTGQEQVAARAAHPSCNACHKLMDPYGLVLENYDNLGRYRTVDLLGKPVDAHATLPAALGGDAVSNAIEMSQKIAASPAFTNCMARTVLQYALVDFSAPVDVPLPGQKAGCAAADVVQRFNGTKDKTFTDLIRATAATSAFSLRTAAP